MINIDRILKSRDIILLIFLPLKILLAYNLFVADFIFLGSKITADGDCSHEIKRRLLLGRKVMTNLGQHIKKQRHYFVNKGLSSQGYGFSSGHVWM